MNNKGRISQVPPVGLLAKISALTVRRRFDLCKSTVVIR